MSRETSSENIVTGNLFYLIKGKMPKYEGPKLIETRKKSSGNKVVSVGTSQIAYNQIYFNQQWE